MALTQYTADTDIIETLGTNPEDRPTLTDDTFKAKFDENSENIKVFLNAMIAELASTANGKGASQIGIEDSGSKFTAATVEAALAESATLISTNDGKLTTHKGEVVSYKNRFTRDLTTAGVQSITGLPFTPKSIQFLAVVSGVAGKDSAGFSDEDNTQGCVANLHNVTANARYGYDGNSIVIVESSGNLTAGTCAVTTNGFNITWGKVGTGATGTVAVEYMATGHY